MYSSRNDVPRKGSGLRSLVMRNEVQEIGIHPEYKDTAESRGRKNLNSGPFAKFTLKRIVNRYIATMFLLMVVYASYGNKLEKNENLILQNELYAVKICAEYRRSFLRSANAIVNFGEGTITIQPDFDPFLLSSDEEKYPNLDYLKTLLDFDIDEAPQTETDLPPLVCKIGKGSRNKKKVMENIMYFNGAGPSSSVGIPLTQEEAERRALSHNISMRYEMIEEVRPVIETLAYSDKYRKLLNEIWADKVKLDGMIKPEEERAMVKVKGQMLKEKKDPRAFIFPIRLEGRINENALADTGSDTNTMPYRIYEQLGRDDIMKEDRNITMINNTEAEVTGRLVNVLCQVGFTTLSAKFLIMEIPVDRDAPIVVGCGFLDTIGGNINIPNMTFTTFDGLTRQTFRAAKSEKIKIAESDSDDEEDYVIKRNEIGTPIHNSRPIGYQNNTNPAENMTLSTLESVINPFRKISVWKKAISFLGSLPAKLRDVEWKSDYKTLGAYDHEVGSSRAKRSRNVETVEEALLPDVHHEFLEWRGCSREAKSHYNSRMTTLLSKLIYSPQIVDWQLLHKIGCGDETDQMLKISLREAQSEEEIFFSMAWVRAFNIREPIYPKLYREFYATYEFDERTTGYEKIQKNDLWLLSMFEDRHQNGYANVAWVIAKWMKRKGARSQKDSQICCGQFISKIARKSKVLTEEIRVAAQRAPRVQRASMQDLYECMGSMEIRQEAIKRMKYRQSYHWDRYQGVFEHMAGVYNVPLQGAYNPPDYA
ncbi:DNA-directed DNA polymerase [Tanacetum coccineum]|uniref:DNA-directed DNA polymerase n=1 Tax=Tanacetum coccineum TaxID=301880 RepID=A0ABQ5CDV7_9ASTR